MSFENPTRLRIGMHGNFGGKDYRIVGRSVLGETEGGQTYYWNEFNLETGPGEQATLVYEETEGGGKWRLFTMFEPLNPLTAADAASKRVGNRLDLGGDTLWVTFCGSSRVYYIEGKGPEGEDVGDVARYFNAGSGDVMQVVSWTGSEVEYYNGVTLAPGMIPAAFNLPYEAGVRSNLAGKLSSFSDSDSENQYLSSKIFLWALAIVIFFFIFLGRSWWSFDRVAAPVQKIPAGAAPLAVGTAGNIRDRHYRVTAHAVVEIDETGSIFERHEYQLADDGGHPHHLVCGWGPGDKRWVLFSPLEPLEPPRAVECAAKKVGDHVNVAGVAGAVRELFQSTIRGADGDSKIEWLNGTTRFGFLAGSPSDLLLARWSSGFTGNVTFERGQAVPADAVTFGEK